MWQRIVFALVITFGITLALERGPGITLPFGGETLLYLAVYVLLSVVAQRGADRDAPTGPPVPLSGPAGQRGAAALILRFTASSLLSLLNPWQLGQQIQQMAGQLLIYRRLRGRLPSPETVTSTVRYTLPFTGEWVVLTGGVTPATSHSWDVVTQRYAYDFVVADDGLRRHRGDGTQLGDYLCYDRPIVAVADGEVVAVRDGVRNAPRVGYGWADFAARDFRGNHVTLRHAEREYSFYAHLVPGSVTVRVGQAVRRGEVIGRCGHSGHSTEPHLHFHFQDGPDFFSAAGLPLPFSDVTVDGTPADGPVYLTRLTRVRSTPT